MPKIINPIRKAKLKQALINGKDGKNAMLEAGFAPSTAHNSTTQNIVKQCLAEIAKEVNKSGLAKKAYKTLEDGLSAQRQSDRNTAAIAILDFTEGKKATIDNKGDYQKVVIAYTTPKTEQKQNRLNEYIPDNSKGIVNP